MKRILPAWWIQHYRVLCSNQSDRMANLRLAKSSAFTPLLSRDEWDALSLILGLLQKKILTNPRRRLFEITVRDEEYLDMLTDEVGLPDDVGVTLWSTLPTLTSRGGQPLPFVSCLATDEGLQFTVDAKDSAALFGFQCPLRRGEAAKQTETPVAVESKVWSSLRPEYRLPYLLMEQDMQSSNRLTGLMDVQGLLPNIVNRTEKNTDLVERLRVLMGLGKVLHEHDWLQHATGEECLLAEEINNSICIGWHATRSSKRSLEHVRSQWLEIWLAAVDDDSARDLVSLFAPKIKKSKIDELIAEWWRIMAAYDRSCDKGLSQSSTEVYTSTVLLFFEFLCRVQNREPLPKLIDDAEVLALFQAGEPKSIGLRFHKFVDLIYASDQFLQALLGHSICSKSPELPNVEQLDEVGSEPSAAEVISIAEEPKVSREAERSEAKRISGALQSRMRKIAAEEIVKMDKKRFTSLKRAYFESLDESARRVMLDVQARMQAKLFDDHLKAHLIRFMVQHPGAWTGGDLQKQGQPN